MRQNETLKCLLFAFALVPLSLFPQRQGTGLDSSGMIDKINYSKTEIDEGDTDLYVAIREEDYDKGEIERYYQKSSLLILPTGKYNFSAKQKSMDLQILNPRDSKYYPATSSLDSMTLMDKQASNVADRNGTLYRYNYILDGDTVCRNCIEADINLSVTGSHKLTIHRPAIDQYITFLEANTSRIFWSNISAVSESFNLEVRSPGPVYFQRPDNFNSNYGFDIFAHDQHKDVYEKIQVGNVDYFVPTISMWSNQQVDIIAQISPLKREGIVYYKFTSDNPALQINGQDEFVLERKIGKGFYTLPLRIHSQHSGVFYVLVWNKNNKLAGKMKVICAEASKEMRNLRLAFRLVLVRIGKDANADMYKAGILSSQIEEYLNTKSFNQAFIQFSKETPVQLRLEESELLAPYQDAINRKLLNIELSDIFQEDGKLVDNGLSSNILSAGLQYKYEQTNIGKEDKASKTMVIFLITRETNGIAGFVAGRHEKASQNSHGNFDKMRYSYLFEPDIGADLSAFAHEMGHCLDLPEAFEELYPIPVGTSVNIMDYYVPHLIFWQWQCDIMKNTADKITKSVNLPYK